MQQSKYKYSISSYSYSYKEAAADESPINVPFSWEYKPGVSKFTNTFQRSKRDRSIKHYTNTSHNHSMVSPPPCSLTYASKSNNRVRFRVTKLDDTSSNSSNNNNLLTLCEVLHPMTSFRKESSSHHNHKKEDDPFLRAYKNCTRSPLKLITCSSSSSVSASKTTFIRSIINKYMHLISCNSAHSC